MYPYKDKGFCEARVHKDFRRNTDGNIKEQQQEKQSSPQVSDTSLPPIRELFGTHHGDFPMTPMIQNAHSLNPVMVPTSGDSNPPKIEMNPSIPLGGDYRFLNQPTVLLHSGNSFPFKRKKLRAHNSWTKKLANLVSSIPCSTPAKPEEFNRVSVNRVVPNHLPFYQPSPFEHFVPMFAPGMGYQQNDPLFKIPHLPFDMTAFEVPTPGFFDNAQEPFFEHSPVEVEPVHPQTPPAEKPIEVEEEKEEEEKEMTVEEIIECLDSISSYGSKPSCPSSAPKSHPTDPDPSFPLSKPFGF